MLDARPAELRRGADGRSQEGGEALAFVRTLYAVDREIAAAGLARDAVAEHRRMRGPPVLDRFAGWLEADVRTARPKGPLGGVIAYARTG